LLEECYEVAEALDRGDAVALREELGDLLFQIVFLSRIAKEESQFTIDDVIRGIAEKMIRRHPHVFGSATAETAEQVVDAWEKIKRQEQKDAGRTGPAGGWLDGVPRAFPAMLKARRLGEQAARVGFDWDGPSAVLEKIEEELGELRSAVAHGGRGEVHGEIGDLLFTVVMLARQLKIDPESALEKTNLKFRRRFAWMEQELERRNKPLDGAGAALLEQLWDESKSALESASGP
jgi:MazG family protein